MMTAIDAYVLPKLMPTTVCVLARGAGSATSGACPFGTGILTAEKKVRPLQPEVAGMLRGGTAKKVWDAELFFGNLQTKYSYLDVVGRTVVVLEKRNVVPEHNIAFQVLLDSQKCYFFKDFQII